MKNYRKQKWETKKRASQMLVLQHMGAAPRTLARRYFTVNVIPNLTSLNIGELIRTIIIHAISLLVS